MDAAIPADAQNAPTGIWKSRTEREIPTAPTPIIVVVNERKNNGDSNSVAKLSTESDQAQSDGPARTGRARVRRRRGPVPGRSGHLWGQPGNPGAVGPARSRDGTDRPVGPRGRVALTDRSLALAPLGAGAAGPDDRRTHARVQPRGGAGGPCASVECVAGVAAHGICVQEKRSRPVEQDRARVHAAREAFCRWAQRVDPRRLVFLDESGANLAMGRSHAWLPRGTELIEPRPMNWGANLMQSP